MEGGNDWPNSYAMWQRSRQSLGGGVSSGLRAAMKPFPLFFERAEGSHMWDVDGHELIDYVLGWGAVMLGHAHLGVTRAVQEQAARGELFGAQHRLEYEVAETILSHLGFAQRLLYSSTGSEAVQVALRLARAATGRTKILKFAGHYHGWPDSVLVSYRPPLGSIVPQLESRGQNPAAREDVLVARWNDRQSVIELFEQHPGEIAAVIAEPVLANSGVISPAEGFLQFLRDVTERHDSVLIFDEVITGFRVGLSGASGRYTVSPDLVTLGKAVANGYPLSVVAGRADLIDQVTSGVVHAGTFNGNPIVLAAAAATLDALSAPGVYEKLDAKSKDLADLLATAFREHNVPVAVHQAGGMLQLLPGLRSSVQSYDGYAQANWLLYDDLIVALLRHNIFVMPGGRLYLSLAHSSDDIAATGAAFERALALHSPGSELQEMRPVGVNCIQP
jgi:glutamate-1-semialdehyde 2,1-aminomutase